MILVDSSIFSLALRRRPEHLSDSEWLLSEELRRLTRKGEAVLIGAIRQEVLSGVKTEHQFSILRAALAGITVVPTTIWDYDEAAAHFNRCAAAGIAGSSVDMLICATATRRDMPIFTSDKDFLRYSAPLKIRFHAIGGS